MLIMVKKGTREGICHSIYWYTKANNKYLKGYDKNKESSYIQKVSNLYGWTMLQKLPVKHFPWIKVTSQFNEDFIKIYIEERNRSCCSVSWKITWTSKWIPIFTWKNKNKKSRQVCSKFTW